MGAVVAFELCHFLRQSGRQVPVQLLLSARRAPQLPPRGDDEDYYKLPDAEFMEKLRELEGTPDQVLEHPELMQLMLPLLRADFELNDTYSLDQQRSPLETPISAYGGLEDEEVNRQDLQAWSKQTRGAFKLRMFPGNHFFLNDLRPQLIRVVAEDLIRQLHYR
jgi:medium-chain acyl-[acyl-carrier-protein] hydrolase